MFYHMYLSIAKVYYLTYKAQDRGVAQPGSASGLGPEVAGSNPAAPTIYEKSKNLHTNKTVQSGYGKTKN